MVGLPEKTVYQAEKKGLSVALSASQHLTSHQQNLRPLKASQYCFDFCTLIMLLKYSRTIIKTYVVLLLLPCFEV